MPIACRMNALSPVERGRSQQLRAELVRSVARAEERDDGYAFELRDDATLLGDLVEWIRLERRCCPFLAFEVRWPQGGEAPSRAAGAPGPLIDTAGSGSYTSTAISGEAMALVGQIATAVLLFFWVGVPMATLMGLTDDPRRGMPRWSMIAFLAVLNFYPVVLGGLYFVFGWKFFILSPGIFLLLTSVAPVAFGLFVFPFVIYSKIRANDRNARAPR